MADAEIDNLEAPGEEESHAEENAVPVVEPEIDEDSKEDFENDFQKAWEDSDIVFVVENEEYHCHYLILKLNSPVFRVMFTSPGFKEGKEKRVNLPGKDKRSFLLFLQLIYPQTPEATFTTGKCFLCVI